MRILIVLLIMFIARPGAAQTVEWTQSSVQSVTQAATYVYRLYVNEAPAVTLSNVACAGAAPTVACHAPAPVSAVVNGASSRLSATDPVTRLESLRSAPFIYVAPVPPSGPPVTCVWNTVTYPAGTTITMMVKSKARKSFVRALTAAWFRIDRIIRVSSNQYTITATCVGTA